MKLTPTALEAVQGCTALVLSIIEDELEDGEIADQLWQLYRDVQSNREKLKPLPALSSRGGQFESN